MISFIQITPKTWEVIQSHVVKAGYLSFDPDIKEWVFISKADFKFSAVDTRSIYVKLDELNAISAI